MAKKTVKYKSNNVQELPNNKPVVYKILTDSGKVNYAGIAKRGRVNARIKEHIGKIPGSTVVIEQMATIAEARQKESNTIKRTQPKYNTQGK